MMKNMISILFMMGLYAAVQGQTIQGKVMDEMGTPLQDVFIYKNKGTHHVHSNELGLFEMNGLMNGDTLFFSSLGFETKSHLISQEDFSKVLKISLQAMTFSLDQVLVSNDLKAVNQISKIDLETNPVNSSQEMLRRVPGLFIGQHAGGGKAEQLFLRGFDIDHGTDVSISVDGMPVNMVSHAHGQGYADLHFLIPETIERLDFGKGPYYAQQGNFTTAGYVNFHTKEQLDNSSVAMEYGSFNTFRTVALFDLLPGAENQHAYIAGEYLITDGPFESSQHFNRTNLLGRYSVNLPNNDRLSLLFSHFSSKWDASGQIPQREVDNGNISRFGAIDDTEGGNTGRTNIALYHTKALDQHTFVKSRAYFSKYDFELFSNFTFFLEDPVNGDQIKQKENRNIIGMESVLHERLRVGFAESVHLQAGLGLRYDEVLNNELSRTLNRRTTLSHLALGDVFETNAYAFLNLDVDFGNWLINPAIRLDYFNFDYVDQLQTLYNTQSERKLFASPKLNVIYNSSPNWQLYLKTGIGFHSNDARVVVAQKGEEILPAAYGADLGSIWKPSRRFWINTALWYLFLDQEFVYVGDAGVVEPSGRSRRLGADVGLRYQATDWLFFDADVNYTLGRAVDEPEGLDLIPLAPDLTATGGIAVKHPSGFSGGLRARYLKDRPANEDNSIVAAGYTVLDMNLNYSWKRLGLGIVIDNVLDTEWNETQFATESRLQNEAEPVEEIHFTPGTPFFVKGRITYLF
ncbi:MAG TPA: TonB-dependent receptor plug domain-containing protein [Saprospiraceae bacterium]|nr:TonB-dependent receptor plug domain-containing protein [Saprospiraceae bacterium]HMQ81481.1 TonB-dependent receptor plug domain-containing protein [Saprospiraceae bacterium]